MGTDEAGRRTPYHPTAESPEELAHARTIALRILEETADDTVAHALLEVCRQMSTGQLAHALLQMQQVSDYPARDRATAEAFLEKHRSMLN